MSTQPSTSPSVSTYKMTDTEDLIYNLSKTIRSFEIVLHEKDKEIAQLKEYIGTIVTSKLPEPVVEKVEPEEIPVFRFPQKSETRRPTGNKPVRPEDKYTKADIGRIIFSTQFRSDCRIEKVSKKGSRIQVMNFNDLKYYWIPSPPRSSFKF